MDQFLSRLPQSVIKDGKIIDVRSGVENIIKVASQIGTEVIFSFPFIKVLKTTENDIN